MGRMKIAAVAVAVVACMVFSAQADLGVRGLSSNGIFLQGGSWGGGPYAENGSLFQLIWAPADPAGDLANGNDPDRLANAGEVVLFEGNTTTYGYFKVPSPLIVVDSAAVGGGNPNAGFLYGRVFASNARAVGDEYFQGPVVPTASLPNYVPTDPGTVVDYNTTIGGNAESNLNIIPEPATLALWGLGALVIALRRKMR